MGIIRPYVVKTLTNLHMGTGDAVGAIDKTVQRDSTTGFPTIYTSGSKGSLKEALEKQKDQSDFINRFFGKDKKGEGSFLDKVIMISLPVQGNIRPFYNAISPFLAGLLKTTCTEFGVKLEGHLETCLTKIASQTLVEPVSLVTGEQPYFFYKKAQAVTAINLSGDEINALENLIGDWPVILPDTLMKRAANRLPVRARNVIGKDGTTDNLWFEEYVPWATRFVLFVESDGQDPESDFETMDKHLFNNKTILNLGANQSVGEGRCLIGPVKLQSVNKPEGKGVQS